MVKRKRTNNDLQSNTQTTKDRATRSPLKTWGQLRCPDLNWVTTNLLVLAELVNLFLWLRKQRRILEVLYYRRTPQEQFVYKHAIFSSSSR